MRNTVASHRMSFASALGLMGLILVLLWTSEPSVAIADEEKPDTTAESSKTETTPEQQRTVTAALYLLVALTVGVVALLLVLILWGARVRREARKPLATISPNDPLWYLKKSSKPPLREPTRPGDVSQETPETQNPSDENPPE
ncbi:MAG: hypothetical protein KDA84_01460 [Planctomycetaceae bacterium]|nr:hypothetical protein [Planctomycetaceae bacterium]